MKVVTLVVVLATSATLAAASAGCGPILAPMVEGVALVFRGVGNTTLDQLTTCDFIGPPGPEGKIKVARIKGEWPR